MNMFERTVDKAVEVYRVLRGLPHNRIALTSVFGGVLLLLGPFWEPYFRAATERFLDISVQSPTEPIFGIGLVVLGMAYHLAMNWIDQRSTQQAAISASNKAERVRDHDIDIYRQFFALHPEDRFKRILYFIDNNDAARKSQIDFVRDAQDFLHNIQNEYLVDTCRDAAGSLRDAIDEFTSFFALEFFVHGPQVDDTFFALQPDLNIDRGGDFDADGMRRYDELSRELHDKIEAILESLDGLIRTAKAELVV